MTKGDHHHTEYINGILPIITKMARFQIVGLDFPGFADIFTLDGQDVGQCDMRGMLNLEEGQKQEVMFIQIWATDGNGKESSVKVMFV